MKLTVFSVISALLIATAVQASAIPAQDNAALDRRWQWENGNEILQEVSDRIDSVFNPENEQVQSSDANRAASRNAAVSTYGRSASMTQSAGSASSTPTLEPLSSLSSSSSSSSAPASLSSSSSPGSSGVPDIMHGVHQRSSFHNMPKFGLSWANKNSFDINHFINRNVGWYYSWDATPGWKNATTDITFCPMLWGAKNAQDFNRRVTQDPNGKYNQGKCVLGINEPNQRGQADMSPLEACSLMAQYVVPLKMHGFHIVSPATTSAPSGTEWMDEFRMTCPGVWAAIDSVALHFYDTSTTKFKNYVNDWHDRYGKPIWVTEYACQNFNGGAQCSTQKTVDFHLEMGNWFEQQDFVQAYAPFGVMREMQGVSAPNRLIQNDQPNLLFSALTS